jgi:hypothetical protein
MSVKIYVPAKNAMQSGKGNIKKWHLEFEKDDTRYIEPIMGWTGNLDTTNQIKLRFDTKEEAIDYAERNGLSYDVIEPNKPKLKIQSYSETLM